LTGRNAKKN